MATATATFPASELHRLSQAQNYTARWHRYAWADCQWPYLLDNAVGKNQT